MQLLCRVRTLAFSVERKDENAFRQRRGMPGEECRQ